MKILSLLRPCPAPLFLALVALSAPARADQITLYPVADASLIEAAPGNNNGGEAWVLAGTTQNYTRNRGLFQFDPANHIPAGSVIQSASLILEITRQPSDGYNPAAFGVHRVLHSWNEGVQIALDNSGGLGAPALPNEVTWSHRFFGTPSTWSLPGGAPDLDFLADSSSQQFIYGVSDSPYAFPTSPAMVADVQAWLDNPAANFGWLLLCQTEDVNFTARRFTSRENLDAPPQLIVEFTLVPEPSALQLGLLALLGFVWAGTAWTRQTATARHGRHGFVGR